MYWWIHQHFKQFKRDVEFLPFQRGRHVVSDHDCISLFYTRSTQELFLRQLGSCGKFLLSLLQLRLFTFLFSFHFSFTLQLKFEGEGVLMGQLVILLIYSSIAIIRTPTLPHSIISITIVSITI